MVCSWLIGCIFITILSAAVATEATERILSSSDANLDVSLAGPPPSTTNLEGNGSMWEKVLEVAKLSMPAVEAAVKNFVPAVDEEISSAGQRLLNTTFLDPLWKEANETTKKITSLEAGIEELRPNGQYLTSNVQLLRTDVKDMRAALDKVTDDLDTVKFGIRALEGGVESILQDTKELKGTVKNNTEHIYILQDTSRNILMELGDTNKNIADLKESTNKNFSQVNGTLNKIWDWIQSHNKTEKRVTRNSIEKEIWSDD